MTKCLVELFAMISLAPCNSLSPAMDMTIRIHLLPIPGQVI